MAPRQDLNDPNLKCVFLSAADPFDADEVEEPSASQSLPVFAPRDLPDGYELRLSAYRRAWVKCLERIQFIVHSLYTPVVAAVVENVHHAYSNEHKVLGLPYEELPVIAVSAPGGSKSVMSGVIERLKRDDTGYDDDHQHSARKGKGRMVDDSDTALSIVSQLYPADCPNLMAAMKSIISSIVDRDAEDTKSDCSLRFPPATRRRATTSLANYDMQFLKYWYDALSVLNASRPNVVIILHNFEQFDSGVMENVFSICSQYLPDLPLVFLLDMSTPSPSSFLRAAYSRKTLSLLRADVHSAPSGVDLVHTVVEKTFFDLDFTPDIALGHGVLSFVSDFCSRHTASIDALTTIVQLAYLKHVEEPLTIFIHDWKTTEQSAQVMEALSDPSSASFLSSVMARIWSESTQDNVDRADVPVYLQNLDWNSISMEDVLDVIDHARDDFIRRAQQMRLGYQVLRLVHDFMRGYGYKPSVATSDGTEESPLDLMSRVMQGKMSRDIQHLGRMTRKLSGPQLEALLAKLYSFFYELEPSHLRHQEKDHREFIVRCRSNLPGQSSADKAALDEAASDVAEWLTAYLDERLQGLSKQFLCEIWSTGSTSFPSELINPAPRQSIVQALLYPHSVVARHAALFGEADAAEEAEAPMPAIWELPDTSILFHRYMEAGKMLNVYDWFESFAVVLDTQRERLREAKAQSTPKGRGARGKARGKGKANGSRSRTAGDEDEEEGDEDEDEMWKEELQARFIRALHELDYMGFVKHTGRKVDHVTRTISDVLD